MDMEGFKLPPYKFLDDIKMKRSEQKIIGRVVRLWEVRNPKNGYEIISINFLLLDEKVMN